MVFSSRFRLLAEGFGIVNVACRGIRYRQCGMTNNVSLVASRFASFDVLCIIYHQQNSLIDLRSLISVGYFLHWSKTVLIWADQMEKGAISSFAVVALVMVKAPFIQILSYLGPTHPRLGEVVFSSRFRLLAEGFGIVNVACRGIRYRQCGMTNNVSLVASRFASFDVLCIIYHQQNSLIDLRSLISVGYFLHWSKTVLIWADQMEKGAIYICILYICINTDIFFVEPQLYCPRDCTMLCPSLGNLPVMYFQHLYRAPVSTGCLPPGSCALVKS